MSEVSPYIAYARALDALGWSPVEFKEAQAFGARLMGLMLASPATPEGLPVVMAFAGCRSVHTCFMPYPIDIAFIDRSGYVLAFYPATGPWQIRSHPGAWAALERASKAEDCSYGRGDGRGLRKW